MMAPRPPTRCPASTASLSRPVNRPCPPGGWVLPSAIVCRRARDPRVRALVIALAVRPPAVTGPSAGERR